MFPPLEHWKTPHVEKWHATVKELGLSTMEIFTRTLKICRYVDATLIYEYTSLMGALESRVDIDLHAFTICVCVYIHSEMCIRLPKRIRLWVNRGAAHARDLYTRRYVDRRASR